MTCHGSEPLTTTKCLVLTQSTIPPSASSACVLPSVIFRHSTERFKSIGSRLCSISQPTTTRQYAGHHHHFGRRDGNNAPKPRGGGWTHVPLALGLITVLGKTCLESGLELGGEGASIKVIIPMVPQLLIDAEPKGIIIQLTSYQGRGDGMNQTAPIPIHFDRAASYIHQSKVHPGESTAYQWISTMWIAPSLRCTALT